MTVPLAAQLPADEFLELRPVDYAVTGDEVPTFSTRMRLDDSWSEETFSVEFPELAPLSKEEVKRLKSTGFRAGEMPEVSHLVSTYRKQRYADISFAPFVVRNGRWYRITSVKIAPSGTLARNRQLTPQATVEERYASKSVLSEGKWIKIRVSEEGIYELTRSKLAELGFTDMNRVKLYGYGGRILPQTFVFSGRNALIDDLREVPLYHKAESVLFFAEGTVTRDGSDHKNNHYSRHSYYFLTEGDSPASLQTAPEPSAPTETETATTRYLSILDHDAFGWYAGGSEMYDSYDFATGNRHSFKLSAPQAVAGTPAHITVAFTAASMLSSTTADIQLNGSALGKITVGAYDSETESARESRSSFTADIEPENTFTLTTNNGNNARLNFISLLYTRQLDASAPPYSFVPGTDGKPATLLIANAHASTQVWQLGDGEQTQRLLPARLDGNTLRASLEDDTRRCVIVDVEKTYPAPQVVGDVPNQNLHADGAQDMVIVIPQSGKLLSQAERLAEAHRAEGLRVRIARTDEIYNEFSSGTPDATAIRRYLKMLYDRAANEADLPRYLLLFGDCAWDNRMLSSDWRDKSPEDYLPAYEMSQARPSSNSIGTFNSYVTDDYFGLLDDHEGAGIEKSDKVDIGIGRFPCHDAATAEILVQKTLDYMANQKAGMWKNRIVMIADYGDNNLHMKDCEDVTTTIRNSTSDKFTIEKVYLDSYTRTSSATGFTFPQATSLLKKHIHEGALLFNYTGHGSPNELSHTHVLKAEDFSQPTQGNLPVWIFAACEITPYDQPTNDIGRQALFNKSGGAIAVFCATRSVYANYNKSINQAFSKHLLNGGARLGDAIREAKAELTIYQTDLTINCRKYVLLGDPALRLLSPTGRLVIDSINGQALTAASTVQLKAGSKARFSGYVCGADGTPDKSFDGEVTGSLFDREKTIVCKNNNNDPAGPYSYKARPQRLFQGSDSVRQGRFELLTVIPRDISYSTDAGRLALYAVNNDHTMECNGYNEQFYFNGTETATPDSIGPRIYLWLNTPDFPNGGFTNTSALFGATVSDSAGINVSGAGIGHDLELVLDGNTRSPIVLNDYFVYQFGSYREGSVNYPLKGLSPGRHTLTMRAWDVNENSSTASLDFTVRENYSDGFGINATRNPASSQTTFITTLESDEEDCTVRTEVYDTFGRLVWHEEKAASNGYHSAPWNLRDTGGRAVATGIYLYRAIVKSAKGRHETKTKKMIVVKQ